MINHINKTIDIKALESRLAEELEEKLEFSCYGLNFACDCDGFCAGNATITNPCAGNGMISACLGDGRISACLGDGSIGVNHHHDSLPNAPKTY